MGNSKRPFLPREFLLPLVSVKRFMLGIVLAGVGQVLGHHAFVGHGLLMAIGASLLGGFHVLLFTERSRRAHQESAQQYGSGQNNFPMGHITSTGQGSNCIATRVFAYY